MDTAQAKSPRSRNVDAGVPRSLRTGLILAGAALGMGAILLQPFGIAEIFPNATASVTTPVRAVARPAAEPRLATGLTVRWPTPLSPPPPEAIAGTAAASSPQAPPAPTAAAAPTPIIPPAVVSVPPPAREALPLQTSVVGGPTPFIGVAARPAATPAQVSGSSTRPANSNPNG